ncbi:MAG: hypothetical protein ACOCYU_03855, partial [Brevefilum sp.]
MKSDLDQLLKEQQADALWAIGSGQHNAAMVYLTGGGHMTWADAIKLQGKPIVLCHATMEREEAARTGLQTLSYSNYPLKERMQLAKGDRLTAHAMLYKRIFEELGLTEGKVLVYGKADVGKHYNILKRLQDILPELAFEGDFDDAVLLQAMATKEQGEIDRIR